MASAAEAKVTSEVHHFSKEEVLDATKGGTKLNTCGGNTSTQSQESQFGKIVRGQHGITKDEEDLFECLLGANGEVVLWSPLKDTVLSRFDFVYPAHMHMKRDGLIKKPLIDADGDLEVTRKNDLFKKEGIVLIEHQNETTLDLVGEQVWRGSLFLADFVLHRPDIFKNAHILEVAAGVGLTSIVAAMVAKSVTITDIDRGDILGLISRNVERNKDHLSAKVDVREIDFFNHATIDEIDSLKNTSVLLAADVVYQNQLTDAFFRTVLRLLSDPPDKTIYIALEKRFVFTLENLDTVAPCYDYFLDGIEWLRCQNTNAIEWTVEEIPNNFDQYFTYERTRHLVLWRIHAKHK